MFMFQTLKFLPAHILFIEGEVFGVVFFTIVAIVWLLVPFWELRVGRDQKMRPMKTIGIVVILYIIALTVLGYIL